MTDGKVIYLFSSAPLHRPAYRRGVLDALAYHSGHRILMSYRRTQVQPELLQPRQMEGRAAAIVFLDEAPPGGDHSFIPIRLGTIVMWSAPANASRVEVRVEFGDFVESDGATEGSIKSLRYRPVPYRPGSSKYYFALEETPVLRKSTLSFADTWETLAAAVSKTATLRDAVILSVSNLRDYGGRGDCKLGIFENRDRIYMLRPNNIYEMDLRVYENSQTNFEIKSSSDLIAAAQAFPTTIGGSGSYRVILSCKRNLETTIAVVSVDIAKPDDKSGALKPVVAATVTHSRPVLLVRIAPSRAILIAFVALAFTGLFLSSLSKDFFQANASLEFGFKPDNAALLAKMTGSALLALAAWLGFRKLPGGSA